MIKNNYVKFDINLFNCDLNNSKIELYYDVNKIIFILDNKILFDNDQYFDYKSKNIKRNIPIFRIIREYIKFLKNEKIISEDIIDNIFIEEQKFARKIYDLFENKKICEKTKILNENNISLIKMLSVLNLPIPIIIIRDNVKDLLYSDIIQTGDRIILQK